MFSCTNKTRDKQTARVFQACHRNMCVNYNTGCFISGNDVLDTLPRRLPTPTDGLEKEEITGRMLSSLELSAPTAVFSTRLSHADSALCIGVCLGMKPCKQCGIGEQILTAPVTLDCDRHRQCLFRITSSHDMD